MHAAVDDHSRLAYAEIHPDEKGSTAAGFLTRAAAYFTAHGIRSIDRVGATHRFIRPHCPWTNGKVERFNRTLALEWAYSRIFTSNQQRGDLLPTWLNHYNLNRPHLGTGGRPPIDRVNNPAGQYT